MNKIVYLIIVLSFSKELIAQNAFNLSKKSINYNSFSLLNLSKTEIGIQSQYSKNTELYSASQSSFTRTSIESGIIGFGFIPLKIQAFYSTESQNTFMENYFRLSFDLNLLVDYQKSKILTKIDEENNKLIHQKRDFYLKKDLYKAKNRSSDSLIQKLQNNVKSQFNDSVGKLKDNNQATTEGAINGLKKKSNDSLSNLKKSNFFLTQKDSLSMQQSENSNNLNDSVTKVKNNYDKKIKDSINLKLQQSRWAKADSNLKEIEKIKVQKQELQNELNSLNDSITKRESQIKALLEIAKNPKQQVQQLIGKNIRLPKNLQIGRINPYFSPIVFNGTAAKGLLLEFESKNRYSVYSFGRLAGYQESFNQKLNFNSEYVAIKSGFKQKNVVYEIGSLVCYKNIVQGNQFCWVPFVSVAISTLKNVMVAGEFAKSFNYHFTQIENTPKGEINSGYAANLNLSVPISSKSKVKLQLDKSSQSFSTPGNPYYISGLFTLLLEYHQSTFKDKLKIDIGIRENLTSKASGKYKNQTFNFRLRTNFHKAPNILMFYLPIQSTSQSNYSEIRSRSLRTNIFNIMVIYKLRLKGKQLIQNFGFWSKSQDGLLPDFQSKNYFYSANIISSKNQKATLNFNYGTGHGNNDSLNQISVRLILDFPVRKSTSITSNISYVRSSIYKRQQIYLLGIKQILGFGNIWIESGTMKTYDQRAGFMARLNLNIHF